MKLVNRGYGFAIGAILMVILLVGAVAGAMALSSRSSTKDVSKYQAKLAASTVLEQATNLFNGYAFMVGSGIDPDTITADNASGTGLYDPQARYAFRQSPSQAASTISVSGGFVYWRYKKTVKLNGVGTTNAPDYLFNLLYIPENVCQAINNMLYGDSLASAPPVLSSGIMADWMGDDPSGTDNAIDASADPAVAGKLEGCFQTQSGSDYFVYYKVMQPN